MTRDGILSKNVSCSFFATNEEMDAECDKRLVLQITKQVSNMLARPDASNDDKKRAYEQLLGIRWSKPLIKEVSPHMLSGLVRRGLYNPATTQMARILRNGLSEIWRSIGGEVDADSGSCVKRIARVRRVCMHRR